MCPFVSLPPPQIPPRFVLKTKIKILSHHWSCASEPSELGPALASKWGQRGSRYGWGGRACRKEAGVPGWQELGGNAQGSVPLGTLWLGPLMCWESQGAFLSLWPWLASIGAEGEAAGGRGRILGSWDWEESTMLVLSSALDTSLQSHQSLLH